MKNTLVLSNAGELLQTASSGVQQLYADKQSVYSVLSSLINEMSQLTNVDSAFNEPLAMLTEAQIQVEEVSSMLRHYQDSLDLDPQRLQFVESRISQLHQMAKKHMISPEELMENTKPYAINLAA